MDISLIYPFYYLHATVHVQHDVLLRYPECPPVVDLVEGASSPSPLPLRYLVTAALLVFVLLVLILLLVTIIILILVLWLPRPETVIRANLTSKEKTGRVNSGPRVFWKRSRSNLERESRRFADEKVNPGACILQGNF